MEQFLQIAALVSAGVIFALLLVGLAGAGVPRQARILRFRRSLKLLDDVAARWAMEQQCRPSRPADEMAVDPRRHQRRPGRDS